LYRVLLSKSASRFYEEADAPLQRKLDRCFEALRTDPRRHPNIKSLKGELQGYCRYRVGDYRIVYRIEETEPQVLITVIAHRRESY
jgi:mRNA interferase RelE/StbE